ncbi:YciI family protein [Bacillus nitroreducens]
MREYIYTLKLIPRLYDEQNWTEEDRYVVQEHFVRLEKLCDEGKVILAGKTDRNDEYGFGIVIFKEESDSKAEAFMKEDPTVKKGLMSTEVSPYRIALLTNR